MATPPDGWADVAPSDVTDRWVAPEAPPTDAQLEILIGDAEDIVLRSFPDLPAKVEAGTVPKRRLVRVIARMVTRHALNPSGVRSLQQSTGPYSSSTTMGGDSPGEMYLTDEDRADLADRRATGRAAFAISPSYGRRR